MIFSGPEQIKFQEGVEHFNHGRFFEAHEAWEELWLKDRKSPKGILLMGLIQLAAWQIKLRENRPLAARRLAESARQKLAHAPDTLLGFDIQYWRNKLTVV